MTRVCPRPVLLALGILMLLALTTLVVDARVARWAAQSQSPLVDLVVGVLNPLGSGVVPLGACATVAVLSHVRGRSLLRTTGTLGAIAFVVAGLVEFSLKRLVGRYRPDAGMEVLAMLGPSIHPDVDSFPSGHATSVFAVATVFASAYPRLGWLFYAVAAAIAAGRVYLARHYVSDVLAGAVTGIVVAWVVIDRFGPGRPER